MCGNSVEEHAGIGCFGVEAENLGTTPSPLNSITCNDMQDIEKGQLGAARTRTGI